MFFWTILDKKEASIYFCRVFKLFRPLLLSGIRLPRPRSAEISQDTKSPADLCLGKPNLGSRGCYGLFWPAGGATGLSFEAQFCRNSLVLSVFFLFSRAVVGGSLGFPEFYRTPPEHHLQHPAVRSDQRSGPGERGAGRRSAAPSLAHRDHHMSFFISRPSSS